MSKLGAFSSRSNTFLSFLCVSMSNQELYGATEEDALVEVRGLHKQASSH